MRKRAGIVLALLGGAFVVSLVLSALGQNRYEMAANSGSPPWVLDRRTGIVCSASSNRSLCSAPHRGSGVRSVSTAWAYATELHADGVLPLSPECSALEGGRVLPVRCYRWRVAQTLGLNSD